MLRTTAIACAATSRTVQSAHGDGRSHASGGTRASVCSSPNTTVVYIRRFSLTAAETSGRCSPRVRPVFAPAGRPGEGGEERRLDASPVGASGDEHLVAVGCGDRAPGVVAGGDDRDACRTERGERRVDGEHRRQLVPQERTVAPWRGVGPQLSDREQRLLAVPT